MILFIVLASGATVYADSIDEQLLKVHREAGVEPREICDDATFLRRLSLDLVGRVPTISQLQAFLVDPDRAAAVDRMLESDEHATFWSQLWTTMLVGRGEQRGVEREILRRWLEQAFADQVALDQIAFQLITAEGTTSLYGPVNYVVASREDPVMQLSHTFFSMQLDCARCHDHPHDRWTNDDYVSLQRFYAPVQYREVSGGVSVSDAAVANQDRKPAFLTGSTPHTAAWRRELGLMVVRSKPFSRAMVNRTWHWLMGRGIVDPVDALSRDNPASVPDLLENLSDDLRSNRFQLRPLIRCICLSDAYSRSPAGANSSESDRQQTLFAARTIRPLLPEQWIASVAVALDRPKPTPAQLAEQSRQLLGIGRQATSARDPFAWTPTSQTLVRELSGELPAPLRDLDSLFLATVARPPSADEQNLAADFTTQETLFALIHGNEFMMND